MRNSIRGTLITYLILGLLVTSAFISVLTHYIAGQELEELYDKNMQQITTVLLNQTPATLKAHSIQQKIRANLEGEEELLIQIWQKDRTLLYSSHSLLTLPLQSTLGFGFVNFKHEPWRYFSDTVDDITVQISQPTLARERVILEVSSQFLVPLLLQIPILGLLIWIVVGQGLKPMIQVSNAIRSRDSEALQPLAIDSLPEEIKPTIQALNELLERLDQALKVQRRFTADAAHELRTPLTAVQLQLDLLNRSQSKNDKQEALTKLNAGVKRSIHVVRQLLALAHQEPEANTHNFEKLNLSLLLSECLSVVQDIASKKNISLIGPNNTNIMAIFGKRSSIRILIDNLLDNSIRYTTAGGKIQIVLDETTTEMVMQIIDNGIGIAVAERARVFDRFYRIPGSEESGTGLGLAIVQAIVKQHAGSIQLDDGFAGKGLAVRIIFPKK